MNNKSKYYVFFESLKDILGGLDSTKVKKFIGDSTKNNKTLTVMQLVRYLTNSKKRNLNKLGLDLDTIYSDLKSTLYKYRNINRTDALDINEFLRIFRFLLIDTDNSNLRRKVSASIQD